MKCKLCKKEYPDFLIFRLIDNKGEQIYCPNCCAMAICQDTIDLENKMDFVCEVTGKAGAIMFLSENEQYILSKDIMLRLLAHHLTPEEYISLSKKRTGFCYMIHDDFYTEDGIAVNPII